jgi:hypothetical protein
LSFLTRHHAATPFGLASHRRRMSIIWVPGRIDGTGAFAQVALRARQKRHTGPFPFRNSPARDGVFAALTRRRLPPSIR